MKNNNEAITNVQTKLNIDAVFYNEINRILNENI